MDRRLTRVKAALDAVRADCDRAARRDADPVGIVHRYAEASDRELVALVAACVAFGNAKVIRAKLEDLLERIGPHPAEAAGDLKRLQASLKGWRARVFIGDDIARLLAGARAVQRRYGSLGALLVSELASATEAAARGDGAGRSQEDDDATPSTKRAPSRARRSQRSQRRRVPPSALRMALAAWCDALRAAGGLGRDGARRGPAHLLPDPRGPSGCKRLLLLLRWMARPADGIDLGMWDVSTARLLVPVDVHIHRLARNLGFTQRTGTSWETTEEITGALARFDPSDPVSYDFALCHMGMLQRCPSRRDPTLCAGCGVKDVCIHWDPKPPRPARAAPSVGRGARTG